MKNGDPCTTDWKLPDGRDRRKCPKHGTWMKKNRYHPELGAVCEPCRLEQEALKRVYEKEGGSNKPPVKLGTSDILGRNE